MTNSIELSASSSTRARTIEILYWALPLALAGVQLVVTIASTNRILYEELAESVRNVFWLQHGLIYDGKSSNVGWYATLLPVYKTFGFSLFTAKFVRLALHLVGLYCVAALLRHAMGPKTAIVPLILIATSPILLYFNTLQTSNGSDLPYAAICLVLLLSIRFQALTIVDLAKTFACFAVVMWAAMTYPTFLLYIPSLLLVLIWHFKKSGGRLSVARTGLQVLVGIAGFVVPLIATLIFLRTPALLIHDPQTGAGLFRSGGKIGFDPSVLITSLGIVLRDLFVRGESYYFELTRSDFTGALASMAFGFVCATSIYLFRRKRGDQLILFAAVLLFLISLIAPNLSMAGHQGLRRCTGVLAAFFVLFAVAWNFYLNSDFKKVWVQRLGILVCLSLPLNNVLCLPSLLSTVRAKTDYAYPWFETRETPAASLEDAVSETAKGAALSCFDPQNRDLPCRYQEIYAAIAGYRQWNGLEKIDVKAYDWKTGTDIVLTPTLWTEYYFPH